MYRLNLGIHLYTEAYNLVFIQLCIQLNLGCRRLSSPSHSFLHIIVNFVVMAGDNAIGSSKFPEASGYLKLYPIRACVSVRAIFEIECAP